MSTTIAPDRPARTGEAVPRATAGAVLGALMRQRLRRDRWQILIWLLCIALLAMFSASAIDQTYGDANARAQ